MEDNRIEIGLWEKTSKNGKTYLGGKVTIDGKEYWVSLFNNHSENDKAPKCKIYLKPKEESKPNFSKVEEEIPF